MFKLIIGNRAYSSWSMRGWLARASSRARSSRNWSSRCSTPNGRSGAKAMSSLPRSARCRSCGTATASSGTAWRSSNSSPTASAARDYWPEDEGARGMARSMSAEMHSGFANLRRELPMNVRKTFPPSDLSPEVREGDRPHPAALGAGPRALRRDRRFPVRRLVRGGHDVRASGHALHHLRRPGAAISPAST